MDQQQQTTTKPAPRDAYQGPRLLYSRYDVCGLLGLGLTTVDNLFADGSLETVTIGRRKFATALSVHRLANAPVQHPK